MESHEIPWFQTTNQIGTVGFTVDENLLDLAVSTLWLFKGFLVYTLQ